jgi:hypothetical protein
LIGSIDQSSADRIKLEQFIAEALTPTLLVAHSPQSKIDSPTHSLTLIVATDVMAEKVMSQNQITSSTQDLGWFW